MLDFSEVLRNVFPPNIALIFCPQPVIETPKKNLQIYVESTCTALMRLGEMPLPLLLASKVGALLEVTDSRHINLH